MKIEVLGPGCAKCFVAERNVRRALEELRLDGEAEVEHIDDLGEIINYGVMFTPGLAIDGELIMQGHIPSVEEIKELLQG